MTDEPGAGDTRARFAVSVERADQQQTVVGLIGELDMGTAPTLRKTLGTVPGPVILECGNLEFIDSSGLAAVVAAHKQRGGELTLRNLPPFAREVLEITGLAQLLGVDQGPDGPVS